MAQMNWGGVAACLSDDVLRRGPYGDDYEGVQAYMSFLERTIPSLPGYRMDIDRISAIDDQRAMAEIRETIDLEDGPLVTYESIVLDVDPQGRLKEICIYIRQAPKAR
jgi:hypothetical protein